MIIKGSRYSEYSETRNGVTSSIALPSTYTTTSTFTVVTEQGDTFQHLANRHMNDPKMYWKIADLNKNLGYPDTIPIGTVVKIPLK